MDLCHEPCIDKVGIDRKIIEINYNIDTLKSDIKSLRKDLNDFETQVNLQFSKIYLLVGKKIDLDLEKKVVIKKYVSIQD